MGSAGCHLPHGLSYPICGRNEHWRPSSDGWPSDAPLVPHGFSVSVTAPAVFRLTARADRERHLQCARLLDASDALQTRDATPQQAGDALHAAVVRLMQAVALPSGLQELGYGVGDIEAMAASAFTQKRLIDNAPIVVSQENIAEIYRNSLKHW